MTTKKTNKKEFEGQFDIGLGGIFKGLGELVNKLSDLSEKGKELKKTGEIKGKKLGGVYGFSVKVGIGDEDVNIEPFGNVHKDKKGDVSVDEVREPLVDIFEETGHILIVAEMPGIEGKDIKIDLKDDILQFSAETKDMKYQKEILLKESFSKDKMTRTYKNGILEIKLMK
ncbi:MAG TPA: Hsp20/alpha crystallin family protein [Candidatus Wujingus californicus]|uniref:Hsp20/alpha crystallin family protein n=1 Tax=Candidatus Wujingus californicus TaxID=3367618 RepID=UPI001DD984CD|nr:Hsp20/alpha crystallin family protein [Planctomycetota bacterium]MDO8131287.1 Hsp20/alpha crystallin family protein [Candidatus Brocadiales bacterium]